MKAERDVLLGRKIIIAPAWITEPRFVPGREHRGMTARRRLWNRLHKWKYVEAEVAEHPIMQTRDLLIMTARMKAKLDQRLAGDRL